LTKSIEEEDLDVIAAGQGEVVTDEEEAAEIAEE